MSSHPCFEAVLQDCYGKNTGKVAQSAVVQGAGDDDDRGDDDDYDDDDHGDDDHDRGGGGGGDVRDEFKIRGRKYCLYLWMFCEEAGKNGLLLKKMTILERVRRIHCSLVKILICEVCISLVLYVVCINVQDF